MKLTAPLALATVAAVLVSVAVAAPASASTTDVPEYVAPDVNLSAPHISSDSAEAQRTVKDATPFGTCATRFAATGPMGGAWSREYTWIGCSYWGTSSSTKKTYSFTPVPGQLAPGCGQGLGYRSSTKKPYWGSVGCYESSGSKLEWGNVAAVPKFKVKTMIALIASSNWWN